jgi:hypothetical protein
MIVSVVTDPPVVVVLVPVTVIVAVPAGRPGKLAEIVAVPGATAVTAPVEVTLATPESLEVQVTWPVMFSVLAG